MFGRSRFQRNRATHSNELSKRAKWTFRLAVCVAIFCGVLLTTSTVWESKVTEGLIAALGERDKLLSLLAATCGLMAIYMPLQAVPKAYIANAVTGGLSAFGAVVNAFEPQSLWTVLIIVAVASPIFMSVTITWRFPKSFWEGVTWTAIASIAVLGMILMIINTPMGILIQHKIGENATYSLLAIAIGVAGTTALLAWAALCVKASGQMLHDYNSRRPPFTA